MLPPRLLMVHNARARRQHNIPKLSARQQLHDPFFEIDDSDVIPRGDDACLIDPVFPTIIKSENMSTGVPGGREGRGSITGHSAG